MTELKKYENELFQIVRYHMFDIKINIVFSSDFGVPYYSVVLKVCDVERYTGGGVNLYKRYKDMIKVLENIYESNLYKYDTKPVK